MTASSPSVAARVFEEGKLVAFMTGQTRSVFDFEDIGDGGRERTPARSRPSSPFQRRLAPAPSRPRSSRDERGDAREEDYLPSQDAARRSRPSAIRTVPLPAKLTAGTGRCARPLPGSLLRTELHHPMGAGIAIEGIQLVKEYLAKAVKSPGDLDARGNMMRRGRHGRRSAQKGSAPSIRCRIRWAASTILITDDRMVFSHALRARLQPQGHRGEDRTAARALGIAGGFDGFQKWVLESGRRSACRTCWNSACRIPRRRSDRQDGDR